MRNAINTTKKGLKRHVFRTLIKCVDLSEDIYNMLKSIKFNYKELLIDMFEEKDHSIHTKKIEYKDSYMENKYIQAILSWLASIFGVIEEDIESVIYSNTRGGKMANIKLQILPKHQNIRLVYAFASLIFMFLFYYFFT